METVDGDDSSTMSQAPSTPLRGPIRETIDVGAMELPPLHVDNLAAAVTQENDELPGRGQSNTQESQSPVAFQATRKSRERFSFAKQKLIGTRSLFLKSNCRGCFPDHLVEIVGRIEECPRAVNSHRFRIDWRKNNGHPLPPNLLPEFLEEYYPNNFETKEKLRSAIARYNEVYGGQKKQSRDTANIDGAPVSVGAIGGQTPPQIARGRAAVAARTTANYNKQCSAN